MTWTLEWIDETPLAVNLTPVEPPRKHNWSTLHILSATCNSSAAFSYNAKKRERSETDPSCISSARWQRMKRGPFASAFLVFLFSFLKAYLCRSDRCEVDEQQLVGTNRDTLDTRSCAEESREYFRCAPLCRQPRMDRTKVWHAGRTSSQLVNPGYGKGDKWAAQGKPLWHHDQELDSGRNRTKAGVKKSPCVNARGCVFFTQLNITCNFQTYHNLW